ncbi:MAG TPA: NADH-quinone oxidoreductase subunit M, partial [Hyphomicrobiaceae bacterium]|nr:NADH-quinone oxidoreductase subunit M [Hyphomicrobiaceae bacterium]
GYLPENVPLYADMTPREIAVLAPLVFLTILFGVWPAPILDVTARSVQRLVTNYEAALKAAAALAN